MEKDVDTIILDNGKEYGIIKEKNNYLYLVNLNDSKDVFIRKVIIENGKECLLPLDNEEEVKKALLLFNE